MSPFASRARSSHAPHAAAVLCGPRIGHPFALRAARARRLVDAGVIVACSSILSCGSVPVPAARVDSLRPAIDRATHAGAHACAPREIALARAHYDFAQVELRAGNAARAERHIAVAEQNLGAAQVLTPDRGCNTASDEIPAIPSSSVRPRSVLRRAADGGSLPLGAVKNTDAECLTFNLSGQTDSARALTASQMSQHDRSCVGAAQRSLRLAVSMVERSSLTSHLVDETRLDEPFAMSYVLRDLSRGVLSISGFEL